LLLNKKGNWSSRELNPTNQIKISSQGEKLFNIELVSTWVRSTNALDALRELSEYHLPVPIK